MNKLIILDRDGVINYDSKDFIKSPDEWIPLPGSLEAILALNQAGYVVTIASNQSGVARQLFSTQTLDLIHQKMHANLSKLGARVDGIFICPHHPDENCECRKPKPGLIHEILKKYNMDPKKTLIPVIGDSLRDLESATTAFCSPILVLTGNGQKTIEMLPQHLKNIKIFNTLLDAVKNLLSNPKN